jgi:hypothetical protein
MTVRLGIVTRNGHGVLIRERFGLFWAWISAFTLFAPRWGAAHRVRGRGRGRRALRHLDRAPVYRKVRERRCRPVAAIATGCENVRRTHQPDDLAGL